MFYLSHQCQMWHNFSILDSLLKFQEKFFVYQICLLLELVTDLDQPDPDPARSGSDLIRINNAAQCSKKLLPNFKTTNFYY
jgi:hypothetical protein